METTTAGTDRIVADRQPSNRFSTAVRSVRHALPYPDEWVGKVHADDLQDLVIAVQQQPDASHLLLFARTMPSRQLMLVFPALGSQTVKSDLTERLMLIIRERACDSLLQVGYIVFQRTFPHPMVAHALDVLSGILRVRGIPFGRTVNDFVRVNSRSLVARCARKVLEKGFSLHEFLTHYRIDPLLPFGERLCTHLFKIGDEHLYQDSDLLFEQVLLRCGSENQATILTRFFKLQKLPAQTFDAYCQIIYEHLGEPVDNLPAWDHVRPKDMVRYAAWIREATIGSHFKANPDIARFFLRYRRHLSSVTEVASDTIDMHFPGFSITHCHRWPQSAMYRDLSGDIEDQRRQRDPGDSHPEVSAADPRRPHRLPLDAIQKSSRAGRVLLPLDTHGIHQSAVFLDYCLSRFRPLSGLGRLRARFRSKRENL